MILRRQLRKVPIRILVNGTRGKSTTVRIIYHILRAYGKVAVARTTGDEVREYGVNGIVTQKKRRAPANISEIIRLVRRWSKYKPEVMVLESMVIQPVLQPVLTAIFRPTHIIFTNFIEDHLESQGFNIEQIRQTLLSSIHPEAVVFLPREEKKYLADGLIHRTKLICFTSRKYPKKFDHIPSSIIDDSWGLINTFIAHHGLSEDIARAEFSNTWMKIDRQIIFRNHKQRYAFLNLFSINDVHTSQIFISATPQLFNTASQKIVILNCRRDRPLRTLSFLYLIRDLLPQAPIWLTGNAKYFAFLQANRIHLKNPLSRMRWSQIQNRLKVGFDTPVQIIGLANNQGTEKIKEWYNRKSEP